MIGSAAIVLVAFLLHGTTVESASVPYKTGRIVGGRDADDAEFPYQVSLQGLSPETDAYVHLCGGVIVDERHVITAAHCMCLIGEVDQLRVVAGTRYLSNLSDPNRVEREFEQHYIHENFNFDRPPFDIALIRVKGSFPSQNPNIAAAKIRKDPVDTSSSCVVCGWGSTLNETNPSPEILQMQETPVVDFDRCADLYRDVEDYPFEPEPGMFCTGYVEGGKGVCGGDSGSAVTCDGEVSGLVSWGNGCAVADFPSVHCDVAFYWSWVEATLERSAVDAASPAVAAQGLPFYCAIPEKGRRALWHSLLLP